MRDAIKILFVDDDEEDFLIFREIISEIRNQKYTIEWVSNYQQALKIIREQRHDVYLIDFRLGAESGLDLIKTAIHSGVRAPLILLTGQGDIKTDELAMEAGAADYIIKGKIDSNELERSIRYSIQNARSMEEIHKLNAELEERVQKRTSELFEAIKKLEQTNKIQKQAEAEVRKALEKEMELNELKSRFITIASHEFRTPLSTLLSSASLVSKYNVLGEKEKIEKHIQKIKSSVSNLTGILNDFLSLSKLEEGAISNQPSMFSLKELSEEVAEEMDGIRKESQRVEYIHTGDEMVFLDKQIIRNILINLISNAMKYSENGTIEIHSGVTDSSISISIKDEGIGIPEADKPFLFSRFFRANNAGNVQGTGLGLNIVKRYVELLNGTLDFESEQGKGTTFRIEILNMLHYEKDFSH